MLAVDQYHRRRQEDQARQHSKVQAAQAAQRKKVDSQLQQGLHRQLQRLEEAVAAEVPGTASYCCTRAAVLTDSCAG